MKRNIPDLRADHNEITLEHCYVLLAKLSEMFDIIEGTTKGVWSGVADEINPEFLQDHYQEFFQVDEFSRLFKTELGKGVLVGSFAQVLFERSKYEEVE